MKAGVLVLSLVLAGLTASAQAPQPKPQECDPGKASGFVEVSGCKLADYILVQGPVTIAPGRGGYTPKCIIVPKGTEVMIVGSSVHPLQAQPAVNNVANPFLNGQGGAQTAVTKTLDVAGFYGYFCTQHGNAQGQGMAGSILVQ